MRFGYQLEPELVAGDLLAGVVDAHQGVEIPVGPLVQQQVLGLRDDVHACTPSVTPRLANNSRKTGKISRRWRTFFIASGAPAFTSAS